MNMFEQLPLEFQLLSALGFITFIAVILGMLVFWFLVVKDIVEEVIKGYLYRIITELEEENTHEAETKSE